MGRAIENKNLLSAAEKDLKRISGQKPTACSARKSVAGFKLRQGQNIGLKVTLRGHRAYEFLDRLISLVIPRMRDFRGAPTNGFDGRGNYSLGLREQVSFPEIDFNEIDRIRGLQITLVTSARTDDEARRLLELLGVAFSRESTEVAA